MSVASSRTPKERRTLFKDFPPFFLVGEKRKNSFVGFLSLKVTLQPRARESRDDTQKWARRPPKGDDSVPCSTLPGKSRRLSSMPSTICRATTASTTPSELWESQHLPRRPMMTSPHSKTLAIPFETTMTRKTITPRKPGRILTNKTRQNSSSSS